jgi:hypothetical protein
VAIEQLEELSHLLERARDGACGDGAALMTLMQQTSVALQDLIPASFTGGADPRLPDIIVAAKRVSLNLDALTGAIRLEAARVAGELAKLTSGEVAMSTYRRADSRSTAGGIDLSS